MTMTTTDPTKNLQEEIDKYLKHFSSQTLCDGNSVRDALLDLRSLTLSLETSTPND